MRVSRRRRSSDLFDMCLVVSLVRYELRGAQRMFDRCDERFDVIGYRPHAPAWSVGVCGVNHSASKVWEYVVT